MGWQSIYSMAIVSQTASNSYASLWTGFCGLGVMWFDSKDYSWVIIPLDKEGALDNGTIQGDWKKK